MKTFKYTFPEKSVNITAISDTLITPTVELFGTKHHIAVRGGI